MSYSRTKNVFLNVIAGYFAQFCAILLTFVGRRIFVTYLSADYLGINGLYSNILSLLSLAELGMGSVLQFFLYKPVLENDEQKTYSLLVYFKKIYQIIAVAVFCLGISVIPFFKYIIDASLPYDKLITYYIVFLLNSVFTYLVAHNLALLSAHQDNRVQKYLLLFSNIIVQLLHICVLVLWKNYLVYISVTLLGTVIYNALISLVCHKRYPGLFRQKKEIQISNAHEIKDKVKSTFFYKIGGIIINNTDNILISTLVSTIAVGMYSNYSMIVTAVQGFIAIINTSLMSGIGNLNAENDKRKLKNVFFLILLFYHFIAIAGSLIFYYVIDDFVLLWLGKKFVLDKYIVFAIAFNFYITTALNPIWMYREACGIFEKVKYVMLVTAFLNIALSIALGYFFGTAGVLIATAFSKILFQLWYEPHVLFENVFESTAKEYWKYQGKNVFLSIIAAVICILCIQVNVSGFWGISIRALLVSAICCAVLICGNLKSSEFNVLKTYIGKRKNKSQEG